MESDNNVNGINKNNGTEKKPSVFKTICSFIGFIAGAWLFIMSITGGFDNEYEKLQSGDIKGAVDTFIEEDVPVMNTSKEKETKKYSDESEWMAGKSCYMMDNFVVDYGDMTQSDIYSFIDCAYYDYTYGYRYLDLRGINAVEILNDFMRENDCWENIILEGQILNVEGEGNVIQIFDLSTTKENLNKYENNDYTADLNCLVDISMLDNKDEFFVNDFVTIYAMYSGRIPMQNGSYQPLIVAVAMELQ